ncbi:MAG: methyltransferase domain-containing protein [Candidatus Kerfeldbacteria bacterium]|nr:methyltransferase domain-containing protein [Candidatus Kerfeldbacteria bacterium]
MKKTRKDADAFGHYLWDFHRKGPVPEIVERDDGYIKGGGLNYFSTYRRWPTYLRRALRLVRGRVLDVGCGAGQHVLYLQSKGFQVIGIDTSPLAVKVSRLRGVRDVRKMSFYTMTFRKRTFDTVVMLGNNFGLFGIPRRMKPLLRSLARITTSRGRIIAECRDPYKTDDPDHLKYHKINRARGRLSGQTRIRVRYRSFVGPWFDYLFVSKHEMKTLLKGTGWRVRTFLGNGSQYCAVIEKE